MAEFQVEFDWVDAFSARAFRGNGCAVVYHAEHWDLNNRLAFVRETGLTECTFLEKINNQWKIRYYLASQEIPYAGHPTIASAWSLFRRGLIFATDSVLTDIGSISVNIEDDWVRIAAPVPSFGACFDPSEIADIYGLKPDDILLRPQRVDAGLSFVMTCVQNQRVLDNASLDIKKLSKFRAKYNLPDFCEPYLWTKNHRFEGQAQTLGRLLLAPPNPAEDAFTGSATAMMAAWGYRNGHLPARFTHAQGHKLDRTGFAKLSLQGAPNSIQSIEISGQARIVITGHLTI